MSSNVMGQLGLKPPARFARVLLVDEEAGELQFHRLLLEGQGFEVVACPTFDAGLQSLETTTFDFVMVSQGTRAFEGRRVLDRAMELDRHRAVLVITRCIDMPCYLEAMQLGAIDYLEKPIPPADLVRFVRMHVAFDRLKLREFDRLEIPEHDRLKVREHSA